MSDQGLVIDDFVSFFQDVHGFPPFPWQVRLLRQIVEDGHWPKVLDLPTGSGKTSAIDVALFHLALEANRGADRTAPVRMALVVDRRLVVDDAFRHARRLEDALSAPFPKSATGRVAAALRLLSGDDAPPVKAARLRGGMPQEHDWARSPSQPTILTSTVDQIGSRLLFRGYGVSDRMKPIHAGLIGADCLILLDEAHLAEPFRQTLAAVRRLRNGKNGQSTPWDFALLSATAVDVKDDVFKLKGDDRENSVLKARLGAAKLAHLVTASTGSEQARIETLVGETGKALKAIVPTAPSAAAIGVVVNRVARARAVFEALKAEHGGDVDLDLLIGPSRPVDREEVAKGLDPIRTGAKRTTERPRVIVATQTLEVGVDIDLDGMITEAAALDALRQRFGRLNRAGRSIEPYASIVISPTDTAKKADDPVYGPAIRETVTYLQTHAVEGRIDFGIDAMAGLLDAVRPPTDALSPKADAPVLLPAHLDLLSQTSPPSNPSPEIGLFLHGPKKPDASVSIVWRADLRDTIEGAIPHGSSRKGEPMDDDRAAELLSLMPPRSTEAIELPIWAVKSFLQSPPGKGQDRDAANSASILSDAPGESPADDFRPRAGGRRAFCWAGLGNDRTGWISPSDIQPGDRLIVPTDYGGADIYGWNPTSTEWVRDVADRAALPYARRRYAVRLSPGLIGPVSMHDPSPELARPRIAALRSAIQESTGLNARSFADALLLLDLPDRLRVPLETIYRHADRLSMRTDVYTTAEDNQATGIVFMARRGISAEAAAGLIGEASEQVEGDDSVPVTEDDRDGSTPGFPLTLREHTEDVRRCAAASARRLGLPDFLSDIIDKAARWHDFGKADLRFQSLLHDDDGLGPDPDAELLAKSVRPVSRWRRNLSALPENWRHEALSVRIAREQPDLGPPVSAALVLFLIGTHHGHGRPFFLHEDPQDECEIDFPAEILATPIAAGKGPQSLGFDFLGLDWTTLFRRIEARYGRWELARLEAILRLADHQASAEAAERVMDSKQHGKTVERQLDA